MSRSFDVAPLSPRLGAEIRGLDLAHSIDEDTHARLLAAWRDRRVLVFRDQSLSPDALLAFARRFGRLDLAPPFDQQQSSLPGYPEIAVVSNVEEKGVPIGGLGAGELAWHSDMTYRAAPPVGCALFAQEIPRAGGNTHFLDMIACLEGLPADLRAAVADHRLVHDARYTSAGTERVDGNGRDVVDHPLVVTEPLSRRRSLLLGRRRQSAVIGLDDADGKALLDRLWLLADDPRFAITHRWRPGDVVLWGNIAVMHRRDAFSSTERRVLLRAQIATLNEGYGTAE